jgi:hypothetical protein
MLTWLETTPSHNDKELCSKQASLSAATTSITCLASQGNSSVFY